MKGERTFRDRLWEWGLHEPHAFPVNSAAGLHGSQAEIDRHLAPYLQGTAAADTQADDLDVLLPPQLATKYHKSEADLADYRTKNLHQPSVRDGCGPRDWCPSRR